MPRAQIPGNVEIASLKKQVVQQSNLMQAGTGTPWEDRGSLGFIKAFFGTCFKSMFSPGELWDLIRRPETTSDATSFAVWCGVVGGMTWIGHSVAWDLVSRGVVNDDGATPYWVQDNPRFVIDWQTWGIGAAIQMACAIFGTLLLLRLANFIYQKLLPHAVANRIPPALSYNIIAYALGPVLLALIPCFGWVLALVWLFVLLIVVGIRRLHLGAGTGVISGILTFLVVTAAGFLAYFVGAFLWSHTLGVAVTYIPPPPKIQMPGQ
jgi:hypothetical protein